MKLHWWHTDRLARDLANNAVTSRQGAWYMMLGAALYTQAIYSALWFGSFRDWAFFFEAAMVLIVSLVGVHECFKSNGGENGVHFLTRFSALAVPIGVKLAMLGLLLGHGLYYAFPRIVTPGTFRDPQFVYRVVGVLMALTFTFAYYWRIAHHLAAIYRRTGAATKAL
jgi:hypothetical protein